MSATVLRVKRPRSQAPLDVLRLEPSATAKRTRVEDDPEILALSNLMHTNTYIDQKKENHRQIDTLPQPKVGCETVVFFKRKCEDDVLRVGAQANDSRMLIKRLRDIVPGKTSIVNVVDFTSFQDENKVNGFNQDRRTKKARLRMINTQDVSLLPSNNDNKENGRGKRSSPKKVIIVDPLTQRVDDCLKLCHQSFSVKDFLELMTDGSIPPGISGITSYSKILNKLCTNGRGSALHVAALSNDKWGVEQLLSMGADVMLQDSDNYIPAEVAIMAGHKEVSDILYQASIKTEEVDFVYDYYVVHGDKSKDKEKDKRGEGNDQDDSANDMTLLEFEGGTGYWENGVLIFEKEEQIGDIQDQGDLDYDSNDENFEGNDYPDNYDDSDSCNSFVVNTTQRMAPSLIDNYEYGFDGEDNEYCGEFGKPIKDQNYSNFQKYAYDSELDYNEESSANEWADRHCDYD